ncbi:MAG: phosphate ABC transporter substrate-binding protein [Firmicutes bacterium]|nr:phosphate ABC transporter substrate-binding protein [Bacillota bacterium]
MRNSSRIALVLAVALVLSLVSGCGQSAQPAKPAEPPRPQTVTVTVAGSTSVQPVAEKLAEDFMAKNKDVKINVQGGGSSAGVKAAQTATADIGTSSRELKPEEKGLKEFIIAKDGIAIIVHPKNKLENLTLDQVKKVFSGKITNWNDLGQPAGAITVVIREEGSGTRGAFEELIMKEEKCTDKAAVQNSTGAVRSTVASNPNAIGYVSLAGVDQTIKALKMEGVEPTAANIVAGTYKVSRPFLFLTNEDPTGAVKQFIEFALSSEGQDIAAKEHLVKVK